jgi:hypothetical protein
MNIRARSRSPELTLQETGLKAVIQNSIGYVARSKTG